MSWVDCSGLYFVFCILYFVFCIVYFVFRILIRRTSQCLVWIAVMYSTDKCRQVHRPYSLLVNAVDRGAISGGLLRRHTDQLHVWQGTPPPPCMSTNNGQWYRRSGNMVSAMVQLWSVRNQCLSPGRTHIKAYLC